MSLTWEADSLVNAPSDNLDRYKRNYLRQAVCEFRFPTLMEIGETRPPAAFVTALRKEYPTLELANELTLGIGGGSNGSNHSHIFRSSKLTWTVSLKQSSVAIETTAYTNYAQLRDKVLRVVDAAAKVIDSDFFTRIGLRYINVVDTGEDPAEGWINPQLVGPILSGCFSGINEYAGRLQLAAEDGGCLLQHGLRRKEQNGDLAIPKYTVDIDSFRHDVAIGDAGAALDAMHSQAFDMFDWAIGPKAREQLAAVKAATKT